MDETKKIVTVFKKIAIWTFPAFFAALIAVLAYCSTLPSMLVNVILIFTELVCIVQILLKTENNKKLVLTVNVNGISIMALAINIQCYNVFSPVRSLYRFWDSWCGIWSSVCAISCFYFVVLLIRVFKWDQTEYESQKAATQQLRNTIKEKDRESRLERKERNENIKSIHTENRMRRVIISEDAKTKRKKKKEAWFCAFWEKLWNEEKSKEDSHKKKSTRFLAFKLLPIIVATIFVLGYIFLPYQGTSSDTTTIRWMESVKSFVECFEENSNNSASTDRTSPLGYMNEVTEYTLFFIAIVGIVGSAFVLLCKVVSYLIGRFFFREEKEEILDFLDEYATAISVMILAAAILMVFMGGGSLDRVSYIWEKLLIIIMTLLIFMIAVDIVRIALEQCIRRNSLLRKCIRYLFIVIVDCVMSVVMGVISGIHLREMLASLFSFFLPGTQGKLYKRIERDIDRILQQDVINITKDVGRRSTRKKIYKSGRFKAFYRTKRKVRRNNDGKTSKGKTNKGKTGCN